MTGVEQVELEPARRGAPREEQDSPRERRRASRPRALEPEVQQQIDDTLREFAHQAIRFDHVVTRRAGQRRFVDLHMHLPAGWTLRRAAALRASVEQALMGAVPGLRARIELLPSDVEAHFDDTREPAA